MVARLKMKYLSLCYKFVQNSGKDTLTFRQIYFEFISRATVSLQLTEFQCFSKSFSPIKLTSSAHSSFTATVYPVYTLIVNGHFIMLLSDHITYRMSREEVHKQKDDKSNNFHKSIILTCALFRKVIE
jgi:hypothetical protein